MLIHHLKVSSPSLYIRKGIWQVGDLSMVVASQADGALGQITNRFGSIVCSIISSRICGSRGIKGICASQFIGVLTGQPEPAFHDFDD